MTGNKQKTGIIFLFTKAVRWFRTQIKFLSLIRSIIAAYNWFACIFLIQP